MPDAPGSGPTDPENIIRAIRAGADFFDSGLRVLRIGTLYLSVAYTDVDPSVQGARPRWVLTTTRGVKIDEDTFDKLARCDLAEDGAVLVDGARWALVAPLPGDRVQFARLMPA